MEVLGIDIGGTGIKAAVVDIRKGVAVSERVRYKTPEMPTPERVMEIVAQLKRDFSWKGPVGCGYPGVMDRGKVCTAANLDSGWIGTHLEAALATLFQAPVCCVNDADAAGIGEVRFGAARDLTGVTLMVTVGTGIGSGLFVNGHLVPNTEFGHLMFVPPGEKKIVEAEKWASNAARKREDFDYEAWGKRLTAVFGAFYFFMRPDTIVLGGGAAKKFDKLGQYIQCPCELRVAQLGNMAGIIGAASCAVDRPY